MPSVTVEIPERLAALMKGLPIEKSRFRRTTWSSAPAAE